MRISGGSDISNINSDASQPAITEEHSVGHKTVENYIDKKIDDIKDKISPLDAKLASAIEKQDINAVLDFMREKGYTSLSILQADNQNNISSAYTISFSPRYDNFILERTTSADKNPTASEPQNKYESFMLDNYSEAQNLLGDLAIHKAALSAIPEAQLQEDNNDLSSASATDHQDRSTKAINEQVAKAKEERHKNLVESQRLKIILASSGQAIGQSSTIKHGQQTSAPDNNNHISQTDKNSTATKKVSFADTVTIIDPSATSHESNHSVEKF